MTQHTRHPGLSLLGIGASVTALGIALYQWFELYRMRIAGTVPDCSIGEQLDCARVWDSPLSTWLHATTGIPFAAWGTAWGLTCLALALQSQLSVATPVISRHQLGFRIVTAIGSVTSVALIAYSLQLGVFCPTCLTYYVAVWAATFAAWRQPLVGETPLTHAAVESGFITLVTCALVWYPASQTPLPIATMTPIAPATTTTAPASSDVSPTTNNDATTALHDLLANARPELKQALSDTLEMYRNAPLVKPQGLVPRITLGAANAPLRIVEWVDLLCPHCKNLHLALNEIAHDVPPIGWRLETRYYPLDGECNPTMQRSDGSGVRCLAAKALICMTGDPHEPQVRDEIFAQQAQLTKETIWQIVASSGGDDRRRAIETCVASAQAGEALAADIAAAEQYGISGTPLVVVNDKVAPALPVLLYVLMLTHGDPNHPALKTLPPANPPPPE